MTIVASIADLFAAWANAIASLIVGVLERLFSPKPIRVVERPDGTFQFSRDGAASGAVAFAFDGRDADNQTIAEAFRGCRVEIVLAARNVIFRTLELPAQASNFVEGIVRAQIDRLSPWTVNSAIFGCSAPKPIDAGRMSTVVAIMPREAAMGFVQRALAFKPASVAITVEAEDVDGARVKLFEQKARSLLDVALIARALLILLGICCVSAVVVAIGAGITIGRLDAERDAVAQQIAQGQMLLRAGSDNAQSAALRALERQKYAAATITLSLEALTKALPDHTFLTELHVMSDKLQIVGISRDAPSLIRLIEQSPSFTRATFFAPTTRSTSSAGEQFHIEARLEPAKPGAQP
jgi:general secretion pathway protein L